MAQAKITDKKPEILVKRSIDQLRERDAELVRGRFNFLECPGATLKFSYRKYKGESLKEYAIKDGEIITIPRGVAKHLATSGSYPIHEYATDESGRPFTRIKTNKKRYNFESLEFFDDEDLEPKTSGLFTMDRF